jgi:hypothetical protein
MIRRDLNNELKYFRVCSMAKRYDKLRAHRGAVQMRGQALAT